MYGHTRDFIQQVCDELLQVRPYVPVEEVKNYLQREAS